VAVPLRGRPEPPKLVAEPPKAVAEPAAPRVARVGPAGP